MKEFFIAVQRNGEGNLTAFKTSSGRVLSYDQALQEVREGKIEHVHIFKGKDGEFYIRSNADGNPANNLDALPNFEN
jgi:Protein of unknown function (DUF3892)